MIISQIDEFYYFKYLESETLILLVASIFLIDFTVDISC